MELKTNAIPTSGVPELTAVDTTSLMGAGPSSGRLPGSAVWIGRLQTIPTSKGQCLGEEELSVSGSTESKREVETGKESVMNQHMGEGIRQGEHLIQDEMGQEIGKLD